MRGAVQQARGVIQAGRIYEMRAGRIARGKELLEVAQRDPRFDRHLGRTEGRIGGTIFYDIADALPIVSACCRPQFRQRSAVLPEVGDGTAGEMLSHPE